MTHTVSPPGRLAHALSAVPAQTTTAIATDAGTDADAGAVAHASTDADAVLLLAYQCGPGLGSVSQIGWQWFTGMAARRRTTLVTHVRNRAAIEAAPDRPVDARVIYIDTEWFAGPLYRLARRLFPRSEHAVFMVSQLDWFVFDAVALRTLRRERAAGAPWRLLHLLTPVTVSAPTRLHRLGLPVVRGPLNCGLPVPPGFETLMREDAMGLARLRVLPRLVEAVFGSLRHSRVVLVATAATRAALPRGVQARAVAMLENAVEPLRFAPAPASETAPQAAPHAASGAAAAIGTDAATEPVEVFVLAPATDLATASASGRAGAALRVSFVGRLVAVKALPLLLQAVARLRAEGRRVELDVVGDGPMGAAWRAEAAALGLVDGVRWHGAQGAAAVARVMRESDVFCLPSVRESGGAVLLEAMACGGPVIGMDFGGPAEIVDARVGWKVAMPDAEAAVAGLAAALREAQDDAAGRRQRGRCARDTVIAQHTWAARLQAAEAIYARVLSAA
jgi:glycosyltransferase involved in cell wall biosynthesis